MNYDQAETLKHLSLDNNTCDFANDEWVPLALTRTATYIYIQQVS